jgi:hypothetical protein
MDTSRWFLVIFCFILAAVHIARIVESIMYRNKKRRQGTVPQFRKQ